MHCMIYFSKLQPSQRTYQSSQTEIDIHVHAKLCVQASGRQCADGQHREFRDTSGRRRRRLCIALHSHCETRSFNQSAHCYVYILFTVTCRWDLENTSHSSNYRPIYEFLHYNTYSVVSIFIETKRGDTVFYSLAGHVKRHSYRLSYLKNQRQRLREQIKSRPPLRWVHWTPVSSPCQKSAE